MLSEQRENTRPFTMSKRSRIRPRLWITLVAGHHNVLKRGSGSVLHTFKEMLKVLVIQSETEGISLGACHNIWVSAAPKGLIKRPVNPFLQSPYLREFGKELEKKMISFEVS